MLNLEKLTKPTPNCPEGWGQSLSLAQHRIYWPWVHPYVTPPGSPARVHPREQIFPQHLPLPANWNLGRGPTQTGCNSANLERQCLGGNPRGVSLPTYQAPLSSQSPSAGLTVPFVPPQTPQLQRGPPRDLLSRGENQPAKVRRRAWNTVVAQ